MGINDPGAYWDSYFETWSKLAAISLKTICTKYPVEIHLKELFKQIRFESLLPWELLLSHNSRIILHINVNINCRAVNYIEIFILSNVNVCWKVPSFYITVTTLWITHDNGLNFYLWLPSVTVGSMVMFFSGLKKGRREPYHMLTSVSLWKPAHVIKYDGKGLSGWTKKKNMFCFCLLEEQDREDGFCSNLRPLLWRSCIFWCGTEIQSRMVGFSVSGPQKLDPLDTSCSFCCCTTNSTNRSKKV